MSHIMKKEILDRIKRFQNKLEKENVDAAILLQRMDLYYLSGTDRDAQLFVPATSAPLLMAQKDMERIREDSPIEDIVLLPALSREPELIGEHAGGIPERLGLEMDILPANLYQTYRKLFPLAQIVDISSLIREARMVKSAYEISCISKAAQMADSMFEQVPIFLQEAVTEVDLALRVEAYYRGKGHPGIIRTRGFNFESVYGHIMSGKRAAMPSNSAGPTGGMGLGPFWSQSASKEKIGRNEPVLVDYAANMHGYISDQTRIFSLGKLSQKLQSAHEVMIKVQNTLAEKGRSGTRAGDLYELAMEIVENAGLRDGFMGYPDPVPFVGHGVGLELDEWPVIVRNSETILREGMVIALEPKIVFPDEGVVGIESTFVVEKNGMKKLNRFPDTILIC